MAIIPGGVRVGGFIAPTDSNDVYPVVDPIYGIGGFRVVAEEEDMLAIPQQRRRVGMIVYVDAEQMDYRLATSPPTATTSITDWEALDFTYVLPTASETVLGGIKIDNKTVELNTNSQLQTKTFEHNQAAASNTWSITHNLNKNPSVTIVDSGGTVVIGQIDYVSKNELTINFTAAFGGKAYLN